MLAAPFVVRPAEAAGRARHLAMYHVHTREKLAATYWRDGRYDLSAWLAINEFLRDWRTGQVHEIDPAVLDILQRVCRRLDTTERVEILCGYRSPKTNAMLRRRSSGVAKKSFHLNGKAIDFRLTDRPLRTTYRAVLADQKGGVGLYSRSAFIHIDTGSVRTWGR